MLATERVTGGPKVAKVALICRVVVGHVRDYRSAYPDNLPEGLSFPRWRRPGGRQGRAKVAAYRGARSVV
eukprot:927511-Rhodomonas_salina.1